jgi:hypothetical protein
MSKLLQNLLMLNRKKLNQLNQNMELETELLNKVQNPLLPKFIKKSICPQNAVMAFVMLKNASMENVKLIKRNNHQSLSSKSQILTGKARIARKKPEPIRLKQRKTRKSL